MKQTMKKTKYLQITQFFCLLLLGMILLGNSQTVSAAKDKKKPTLNVTANTTDFTNQVVLTIKASDTSGIKEVKYENSYQKTSYFKKKGKKLKLSKGKAKLTVTENGTYTFYALDKAGNTKIKRIVIDQIDQTAPVLELSQKVMNQEANISVGAADLESGIQQLSYLFGDVSLDSTDWEDAIDITGASDFKVYETGDYTVRATDYSGNRTVKTIHVEMELRAVWISYLEFASTGYTEEEFTEHIATMYDNVLNLNMNAVIVQVRPFGDAMYPSKYFPWSKYVSGEQGVDPGYDPLKIMIEEAHIRNLEFHAWINPYRITTNQTDLDTLSDDNIAKIWLTDEDMENDRNVLTFSKNLYYNPSSSQVRSLIVNGVKEIVENYDVDGIHFDDYFYPSLGNDYESLFDCDEYEAYVEKQTEADEEIETIAQWRRGNVNSLVKSVYRAIKAINENVRFGISPHGNIKNLMSDQKYYVDVVTWLSNEGYVDYICPQLYWTFKHSSCPYDTLLNQWIDLRTNDTVSMYVGIANYRAGAYDIEPQWEEETILADMVQYGRDTRKVDGYMFFRYDFFFKEVCLPAVEKLIPILGER